MLQLQTPRFRSVVVGRKRPETHMLCRKSTGVSGPLLNPKTRVNFGSPFVCPSDTTQQRKMRGVAALRLRRVRAEL